MEKETKDLGEKVFENNESSIMGKIISRSLGMRLCELGR
jgi:hypothetical protein